LIVQVAHDIRSPLTSILFLSETLHNARSGAVNAVQERQLGLIYSAAFGLSQIANDLIEMARGGERLMDREPVAFSVADIIIAVGDIVHPMAEEKGLEVRLEIPETLDTRLGQPAALTRALLNLTTNALKYTDEGHVALGAKAVPRTKVQFWVHDTGRGLAPDVLASLFEPFQRRYTRADYAFSSSGLGLSICRKLITLMGGELRVESAPDQGTRFSFTLDLQRGPNIAG
jgi:signal transduction histidine kinase